MPLGEASASTPPRIEGYEIERELGHGSSATVFLAREIKHGRMVALKVLHPALAASLLAERFLREIEIIARLAHPNILPLLDSGRAGDQLYYVTPYVPGESLRRLMEHSTRVSVSESVRIVREVAEALDYAHRQGVVHRDVKPENILLADGHALVADFGIARALSVAVDDRITTSGFSPGTPRYMSPEQVGGESKIDGRSDVYSLACVLYELLAAAPPFVAETAQQIVAQHLTANPQPVRRLAPAVPPRIEQAVTKALAKLPGQRFDTAAQFAQALSLPVDEDIIEGGENRLGRLSRRASVRRVAMLALGAAAVATGMWALTRDGTPRTATTSADTTVYAVFPFVHRGQVPVSMSEDQFMRDALLRWTGLQLVDASLVTEAMRGGQHSDSLRAEDARRLASRLGAGRYLRGSVVVDGDSIRVSARLYDIDQGQVAEGSARVPQSLAGADSIFAGLAERLLFRGITPLVRVEPKVGTRSVPARQAYLAGHRALERWNLASADSQFDLAIRTDPRYAHAALWLALTRVFRDQGAPRWRYLIEAANTERASLDTKSQAMVDAVLALAGGDLPRACSLWASLTRHDPNDYATWYGSAKCLDFDNRVVRDPASPSGWRFRASYHTAIMHYERAFQLQPAILRSLRANSFDAVRKLLKTNANDLHLGFSAPPDSVAFAGFPGLVGDTLSFIPIPVTALARSDPETIRKLPRTMEQAVERQRRLFRGVATTWVTAEPHSAEALEALAVSMQMLGDPSALDTLARALTIATDSLERHRIKGSQVWALVRFSIAGDREGLRRARLLADSLLRERPVTSADAQQLAGFAALLGRANEAARLTSMARNELIPEGIPNAAGPAWRSLEVLASTGGPLDSLRALERRVDSMLTAVASGEQLIRTRSLAFRRAATLVFPPNALAALSTLPPHTSYLVDAMAGWQRGDTTAIGRAFAGLHMARARSAAADLAIDALFPETWLIAAAGDVSGAIAWIDPTLRAVRTSSPLAYAHPVRAATLVRAMALRAELAQRVGDRDGARLWASAVAELWSGADPFLQPLVRQMQALAR